MKNKNVISKISKTVRFTCYSLIMFIAACTNNSVVIHGTLPNEQYHNEPVYWVPFEGATSETVDSAIIVKDAFRITVSKHNLNKMGIVRVRPQLRLTLQELLVYTEFGAIHVKLDSLSSAKGTPLNDVLQNWKEIKSTHDWEVFTLRRKLRTADTEDEPLIKEEIESKTAVFRDEIFQVVLQNKNNDVGKFIYSIHRSLFTSEQIEELETEV